MKRRRAAIIEPEGGIKIREREQRKSPMACRLLLHLPPHVCGVSIGGGDIPENHTNHKHFSQGVWYNSLRIEGVVLRKMGLCAGPSSIQHDVAHCWLDLLDCS